MDQIEALIHPSNQDHSNDGNQESQNFLVFFKNFTLSLARLEKSLEYFEFRLSLGLTVLVCLILKNITCSSKSKSFGYQKD
jgi:hypothetical protein